MYEYEQLQKICGENVHKRFLSKFGEIRAKYPLHPTKLSAPTPVECTICIYHSSAVINRSS